jgi:6,7-dimethyl-8-ribityllumazine synthase
MLKRSSKSHSAVRGGRFAIVASLYNRRYVDSMLRCAKAGLKAGGAEHVRVIRVPGAFEIPAVVGRLAQADGIEGRPSAIVCLGVVLRGETTHADHIVQGVTHALARVQVDHAIPIIHEVLLLENEDQARRRCLDPAYNRGAEAAQTALKMARILATI